MVVGGSLDGEMELWVWRNKQVHFDVGVIRYDPVYTPSIY